MNKMMEVTSPVWTTTVSGCSPTHGGIECEWRGQRWWHMVCHRGDTRVLLVLLGPDPLVPFFSGEFDGCTQIDALVVNTVQPQIFHDK
jgi:hypothetical protein